MLSSNLLKSKIPILWGGEGLCNLMLSSNLLKSKLRIGGGSRNWMLSLNLLKSKIPILWWGGGGWWNQFPTFDAEFNFALKKIFWGEKFSKFSGKTWNGFVLVFEYRVVRYMKYSEPQIVIYFLCTTYDSVCYIY